MEFVIRNDVPLPELSRSLRGSKYPIAYLEEGECFIVPAEHLPTKGANSLRSAVAQYKKSSKTEAKFAVRTLPDGSVGVWRVE